MTPGVTRIKNLLDPGTQLRLPMKIYGDNQAAIYTAENLTFHEHKIY